MKIKNEVYDILKDLAMVWLPAIAVFVTAICGIWGLPYGQEISATIVAVDTLLGACLKISTNNYNKELLTDED